MSADQKDRYIQYLAEQNQYLRLTSDAMKLVLEDFMARRGLRTGWLQLPMLIKEKFKGIIVN